MRLVLDTNTTISGMLWRGAPHQLLAAGKTHRVRLFSCRQLLDELSQVLHQSKFLPRLIVSGIDAHRALADYRNVVTLVSVQSVPRVSRDPDDDVVLACAVTSRSNLIVTGDKDLLVLKRYQNIPVVSSGTALRILTSLAP